MSHFFVCYNVIRFKLMYIIYFNFHYSHQCRYTHYTLFLCLQMERNQEDENNRCNQQKIRPNSPSHESSLSTDNSSSKKWWSIWISMQFVVFFEIIIYENKTFLFNLMDIVPQLKGKGLAITTSDSWIIYILSKPNIMPSFNNSSVGAVPYFVSCKFYTP